MEQLSANIHLINRACFGVRYNFYDHLQKWDTEQVLKKILKTSKKDVPALNIVQEPISIKDEDGKLINRKELNAEQKKSLQQQNTKAIEQISIAWQREMVQQDFPLREQLALFWHGHFACRTNDAYFNQQLLNIIRTHALDKFSVLLTEVSKSAAMLQFLNNQQNKKKHANENFAREVMELFTMGRGNYQEQDVKEAARAFTGWSYQGEAGTFYFNQQQHDDGMKQFLGVTGNFNGDDILKIIYSTRATAQFISKKLYQYFVNDQVNDVHVAALAKIFSDTNGDIAMVMEAIFKADWFYESINTSNLVRSPVQLMVAIQRLLPITIYNEDVTILFEKGLGQWLFYPPNVAGWDGGYKWIDSATLMLRLRIPQLIADGDDFNLQTKKADDVDMGRTTKPNKGKVQAHIDWPVLNKAISNPKDDIVKNTIAYTLGNITLNEDWLHSLENEKAPEKIIIRLMSTPDFQLC